MTTNGPDLSGLEEAPTASIVEALGKSDVRVARAREVYLRIEHILLRRMEAEGTEEAVSDNFTATRKPKPPVVDHVALLPILEAEGLTTEELVADGAVVLKHTPKPAVPVEQPTRFNMTKLKKFAKRGKHIQTIIDGATTTKPATSIGLKVR